MPYASDFLSGPFDHWEVPKARCVGKTAGSRKEKGGVQPKRGGIKLKGAFKVKKKRGTKKKGGTKDDTEQKDGIDEQASDTKQKRDSEQEAAEDGTCKKKARKRTVFPGAQCMTDAERKDEQTSFKATSAKIVEAVTKLPIALTCYEAIREVAPVCEIDGMLAAGIAKVYGGCAVDTRRHEKMVVVVHISKERNADLYRIKDAQKSQKLMVSNASHSAQNVSFCAKLLAVCFACGLQSEELDAVKVGLQEESILSLESGSD